MNYKVLVSVIALALVLVSSSVPAASLTKQTIQTTKPATDGAATITCYFAGRQHTTTITVEKAQHFHELFTKLADAIAAGPQSTATQAVQQQILYDAEADGILPDGLTAADVHTQLQHYRERLVNMPQPTLFGQDRDHEFVCNMATTGTGGVLPLIILPRYLPLIELPVPRIFIFWKTQVGVASIGGLLSHTGFIATGKQHGFSLGFWGIGFSIFLPPISGYALFGYAAFTQVAAKNIVQWNPNNAPEIEAVYPLDGATQVPMNTTQLQFAIQDFDGDLMSYSVVTNPDIGGGNGNQLKDGTYNVPISSLQSATLYTWTVQVTDGKDTTTKVFTFTTET